MRGARFANDTQRRCGFQAGSIRLAFLAAPHSHRIQDHQQKARRPPVE